MEPASLPAACQMENPSAALPVKLNIGAVVEVFPSQYRLSVNVKLSRPAEKVVPTKTPVADCGW